MATLGVIRLQLIEAEFNHDNDVFTKMDPYCKITCENKHWKSSICQDGGKEPKWKDQYFEFQVNSKDSVILF
jgi:Ca2+-dependent lipid-binding protein